MASVPDSVGERIRGWSLVHRVADKKDSREVDKLAEVLKHFTVAEARQLVADAHGRPIICSYSNDGTPMRTTTRVVSSGSLGKVKRVGGVGHELLVQRALFRTRGSLGDWHTVMQVRDPLPLVHGKGGDAIFSAATEFLKTLRQMGHGESLCITMPLAGLCTHPWFADSSNTMRGWHPLGWAPSHQGPIRCTRQLCWSGSWTPPAQITMSTTR